MLWVCIWMNMGMDTEFWTQVFYTFLSLSLSFTRCLFILNRKNITYQIAYLVVGRRKVRPTMLAHIVHKDFMYTMHNFFHLPSTLVHAVIPALHPILRSFAEGAHMSCGMLLLLYNTSLYCCHDQILLLILCVWLERGKKACASEWEKQLSWLDSSVSP
jgi:hypothetical protein